MTHVVRQPRRRSGEKLRLNFYLDEVDLDTIAAAMDVYERPEKTPCREYIMQAVEAQLERDRSGKQEWTDQARAALAAIKLEFDARHPNHDAGLMRHYAHLGLEGSFDPQRGGPTRVDPDV